MGRRGPAHPDGGPCTHHVHRVIWVQEWRGPESRPRSMHAVWWRAAGDWGTAEARRGAGHGRVKRRVMAEPWSHGARRILRKKPRTSKGISERIEAHGRHGTHGTPFPKRRTAHKRRPNGSHWADGSHHRARTQQVERSRALELTVTNVVARDTASLADIVRGQRAINDVGSERNGYRPGCRGRCRRCGGSDLRSTKGGSSGCCRDISGARRQ